MGLMEQVLRNIDLIVVGVTTKKIRILAVFTKFMVLMYFSKLTTRRVQSKLKIIIVLYFVPNYNQI